jgi:hypothetical protein
MENMFELTEEVEQVIDYIKSLKDKTLDHFYEDKRMATKLLKDLTLLEKDASELLLFIKNDVN